MRVIEGTSTLDAWFEYRRRLVADAPAFTPDVVYSHGTKAAIKKAKTQPGRCACGKTFRGIYQRCGDCRERLGKGSVEHHLWMAGRRA